MSSRLTSVSGGSRFDSEMAAASYYISFGSTERYFKLTRFSRQTEQNLAVTLGLVKSPFQSTEVMVVFDKLSWKAKKR